MLQEYCATVTRKLTPGLTVGEARSDLRALLAWQPAPVTEAVLESAWAVADRFGLSWWDALIVAAAQRAGAALLLGEDLQDGQDLDGVRVVNPFRHEPPGQHQR